MPPTSTPSPTSLVGRIRSWQWMPAVVFALGLLSIGMLVLSDRIHRELAARDIGQVCALSELQNSASQAHLWFKEVVSHDLEREEKVVQRFAAARHAADVLLEGGLLHGMEIEPIEAPELLGAARGIRQQIEVLDDFRRRREEMLAAGEDAGIGSMVDMSHDDAFEELAGDARELEMSIVANVDVGKRRARLLFQSILFAWMAIVATAVTGLWSRERRRRLAELALRDSEAQLLQAQKMEAVGRLAGGIAHDINNYLAAMTAQCELVRMKAEHDGRIERKMDSVISTAAKASTLIKRLLAFSRRQPVRPEVVNLNRLVDGLSKMMHRLIGEDVRMETDLQAELWNVKADPSQIEQILVNLLVNAREAMPQGGTLQVRTINCTLDGGYENGATGREGDFVLLEVEDTGLGIPPEIKDKVFEPFFTTKERAGRSGLGLATVYGVVRQSNGLIGVDSEVGRGTTFRIFLPRCTEPATAAEVVRSPSRDEVGGHEKILLVEDNDDLRDSTRGVLEAMGYQVQVAANGEEALQICDDGGTDIDLLITDVVMPGMSGREVMDRMRERKKDLHVIFISGYTDNVILRHGVQDGDYEFLEKPFSADRLGLKIREVLRGRGRRAAGGIQSPQPATG